MPPRLPQQQPQEVQGQGHPGVDHPTQGAAPVTEGPLARAPDSAVSKKTDFTVYTLG